MWKPNQTTNTTSDRHNILMGMANSRWPETEQPFTLPPPPLSVRLHIHRMLMYVGMAGGGDCIMNSTPSHLVHPPTAYGE